MNNSIHSIPFLKEVKAVTELTKGFSTDKKYVVQLNGSNQCYIVRLFQKHFMENKQQEFQLLKRVQDVTSYAPEPIEIGMVGEFGYVITTFLEGQDIEEGMMLLSAEEQFHVGYTAGQELAKLHQLDAPLEIEDWAARKERKNARYVEAYKACGIRFKGDTEVLRYIEQHKPIMQTRPNVLQHDDYHPVNLILNDSGFAGMIDFERFDWGDPVHDFMKVGMFTIYNSVPFSIGQVRGYFNGEEPNEEFWGLYHLYLAMALISAIVWTQKVTPQQLGFMTERIEQIVVDHDHFLSLIPAWYQTKVPLVD